jgi:hypothetical protein
VNYFLIHIKKKKKKKRKGKKRKWILFSLNWLDDKSVIFVLVGGTAKIRCKIFANYLCKAEVTGFAFKISCFKMMNSKKDEVGGSKKRSRSVKEFYDIIFYFKFHETYFDFAYKDFSSPAILSEY